MNPIQPGYSPPSHKTPTWLWVLVGCGCVALVVPFVILPAILFPVFAQAREKARSTACLANIKQMSLGILMYAQDYDERLPDATNWMDSIYPYVKNEQIFRCPSVHPAPEAYGYAFHNRLARKNISKVSNPFEVGLLYDSTTLTKNANDAFTSWADPPRHLQGNNVSFVDGHAKWYSFDLKPKAEPQYIK